MIDVRERIREWCAESRGYPSYPPGVPATSRRRRRFRKQICRYLRRVYGDRYAAMARESFPEPDRLDPLGVAIDVDLSPTTDNVAAIAQEYVARTNGYSSTSERMRTER
jgi:hypothetical protein